MAKIAPALAQDEAINDAAIWANGFSGVGFVGERFLGYPVLAELAQRPEYRRISEIVASEMTREWIELKGTGDDDKSAKIKVLGDAMRHFKLQDACYTMVAQDGFFGRGHLYVDTGATDDPNELKTSIGNGRDKVSIAKIGKGALQAFRPVEAIWSYPTNYNSNDPLASNWYKPESWFVMGKEVHASRFLTFIGREVPDLLKPAYSFGGLSLTQIARPYVEKFIKDAASVSDLIAAFSVMVLTTNLGSGLEMGGEELERRIEFFINCRANRGLMVLQQGDEATREQLENVSAPLGSLDKLQAQSQEHICSVTGLPLIKYTGITPTGLNASSEGEIRSFYDGIHGSQENLLREPITVCLGFIQLSEFGEIDPEITFDFVSLWQLDPIGEATVQKTKADIHSAYFDMGVVTGAEVQKAIGADPDSPYAGLELKAPTEPEEAPAVPRAPTEGNGAEITP